MSGRFFPFEQISSHHASRTRATHSRRSRAEIGKVGTQTLGMLLYRVHRHNFEGCLAHDIRIVAPRGDTSVRDVSRKEIFWPEALIPLARIPCPGALSIAGQAVKEDDAEETSASRVTRGNRQRLVEVHM